MRPIVTKPRQVRARRNAIRHIGCAATQCIHRLATRHIGRAATQRIHRLATRHIGRAATQRIHRVATRQSGRAATQRVHRLATRHIGRAATQRIHRLATRHIGRAEVPRFLLLFLFAACAPAARTTSTAAPTAESLIYDTHSRQFTTIAALTHAMADADVIFFGEQHDDAAGHRAELAYLAALGTARPNVVTSLEMFERDVQPELDRYLAGQSPESVFVAASRPWPRYATDYRGLVELSRAHGWPVVAANVPRRIASAVSHNGLAVLDTMNATDRTYVARDISCPHDAYYARFAQEMTGHTAGGVADANDSTARMTNRFYEAQCIKDETMAESIVRALDRAGDGAVVMHFNGSFHSDFALGTAARVKRRKPAARLLVITALSGRAEDAARYADRADYVVITPATPSRDR